MTESSGDSQPGAQQVPAINTISLDDPWQWLAAGWRDMRAAWGVSVFYGIFIVVFSYLLTGALIWWEMFFLIPPLAAGYLLVAPVLGVGMYSISRGLERNETVALGESLNAWRVNDAQIGAMGLMLMFIMLVWFLIAGLIFVLFFDKPIPTWENFIPVVFLSGDSPLFLVVGTAAGAVLAALVFSVSVVSVPMLLDRPVNALVAARTSVAAVRANWRPMLLWAYLIALFIGSSVLTFYLALVFTFPLIGHATWHAYRGVVAPEP